MHYQLTLCFVLFCFGQLIFKVTLIILWLCSFRIFAAPHFWWQPKVSRTLPREKEQHGDNK
jgi:hypothetical protein